MDELKFSRTELIKVITDNRANHRAEFEKAMRGYEIEATEQLQALIKKVSDGKRPMVQIHLAMPQDHTKDYDRILRMLDMTMTNDIVLEEGEFGQYVMDDWAWKGQFTASNSAYLAKLK